MHWKTLLLPLALFMGHTGASAQQAPEFIIPETVRIIVHSGTNQVILPGVSDGDLNDQSLDFQVESSDENILRVDSITHRAGDRLALIWVTEQGETGSATLTVTVSDPDGSATGEFETVVTGYSHHGIKFEIHDAIFWSETVPLDDSPVYREIVPSTNMFAVYNRLNWNQIPLTVSAGCNNASLCDGHDFNTGFLEGYLVPRVSGDYYFYMRGDSDYALFLSTDASYGNARVIAAKSDNHGDVGEPVNGRKSAAISLDSGRVYALYAAQWNVHHETGGVKWELPGVLGPSDIQGSSLYPEWDTRRPGPVPDVRITATGDRFLRVAWNQSNDDQRLQGYRIYLDGIPVHTSQADGNYFVIDSLEASTGYSVSVAAIDLVNNESWMSEIIQARTLDPDTIPPSPPTSLSVEEATGLALHVAWEGADDDQSGIYGYDLYLDGELFNQDSIITASSTVLKVLEPEREYQLEIVSVDGGRNHSVKSDPFSISTSAFDPLHGNLGLETGRLVLSADAMSHNEGIGVNPDYIGGAVLNGAHSILLEDLKPGAIRWGALTANPLNFSDYTGAGKPMTIGKFMDRCNQFNSYTAFCCGVEDQTDWRKDPRTFIRFLEYVNGPDDTEGGKLRKAEGFTEPLLENSPGLIFEFGNEVWGRSAHNAQIGSNYVTYAEWCREMALLMRSSPWYDSTKIFLVYSARYPSNAHSYGLNEKLIDGGDGEVDWTGPSGYLGGNLDYDPELPPAHSELEYYQNVRNRADSYLEGMMASHRYEVEETGRLLEQYMYESNTTTTTYNGRLGQALLSTDYYLTAMERGSAIPTIFHLTGGQWRITEPENNYRRLPLFLTARYFNHLCKGDVMYNTYHSNREGISQQGATFAERPVGAHAYRNEEGYTVVLISRDYTDDHFVQLEIPEDLNHSGSGRLFTISGDDFSTKSALADTSEVDVKDGMILKVPAFAMVLLHFELEEIRLSGLPLAYYPYPRIEEIVIPEGNHTFTEPGETKRFNAQIFPSDSWDRQVEWTLHHNSGNYGMLKYRDYCTVYVGQNLWNEADSMILRASSRAGDVFGEVVLFPTKPVSIQRMEDEPDIRIYPNPATDSFTVESDREETLRICRMDGTILHREELGKGSNLIRTSQIPRGIYTVQIGSRSRRLVIYSK